MKHWPGGVVWELEDVDDEVMLEVVCCGTTVNCACWAAVTFPLCAVTKIVY